MDGNNQNQAVNNTQNNTASNTQQQVSNNQAVNNTTQSEATITMTQSQIDDIVQGRLAREVNKTIATKENTKETDIIAELGFKDIGTLKIAIEGMNLLKEQNVTLAKSIQERNIADESLKFENLFKENNIADKVMQDKFIKLSSLETGEDKFENLKKTITDFGGAFKNIKVGVDTSNVGSNKPYESKYKKF